MSRCLPLAALCFTGLSLAVAGAAPKSLNFYFVDVEGGQATLVIAPSGQSLLIDTGWPANNGRDADRIAAVAKRAGLKKIDYLLVTHYHTDHAGGVPQIAARIPIGTFIDHGPSVEHGTEEDALFQAYAAERAKGKHLEVKPGDSIPLKGVTVQVLSANGEVIHQPLAGAAAPNPLCGSDALRDPDPSENARSIGVLITFGSFRAIDLGDLTWNKEMDLFCPDNRIGKVDVYIASHHGMNMSGSATMVHALAPSVAIVDNGARKGGTAEAYQAIKGSPGLKGIWQLHYAVAAGDAHNTEKQFIANLTESPDNGFGLRLNAHQDGSFVVTNQRTNFSSEYKPQKP